MVEKFMLWGNQDEWCENLKKTLHTSLYGSRMIKLELGSNARTKHVIGRNDGDHERGIQSGTIPTPLVMWMSVAYEVVLRKMKCDEKRISTLQERLFNVIRQNLDGVVVNRSLEKCYVRNLNLSSAYVKEESLLMGLKEVDVSSGSACTSANLVHFYVVKVLGVDENMDHTSLFCTINANISI
ncbi:hypothetical protein VNO77_27653 [Canavalia gladiata]|uniref:Cysteine desulfurase n=1 Tax=Canavalia gladiata TaxID=3824 RepID=A0AAN9KW69_CANGL